MEEEENTGGVVNKRGSGDNSHIFFKARTEDAEYTKGAEPLLLTLRREKYQNVRGGGGKYKKQSFYKAGSPP